jgi:ribose 5-phosphate isomerase B
MHRLKTIWTIFIHAIVVLCLIGYAKTHNDVVSGKHFNRLIFIGADHKGFKLKQSLILRLGDQWRVTDCGTDSTNSTDYTDYAQKVAIEVQNNPGSLGILICNTGTGMAIAANRFKGIRAIVCHDEESAFLARKNYDANVLVLSDKANTLDSALTIIEKFTSTEFDPGENKKSIRRIKKMDLP